LSLEKQALRERRVIVEEAASLSRKS
jgi:hypothetical protein